LPCGFFFFFFSFYLLFSSPNLSRLRLNVYHTCTHGVALVRIQDAGLKRAARGWLQIQDAKSRQKWPSCHRTILSGYIFATKAPIDNRNKLLSSNISYTRSHNIVNMGPLAAEIGPVGWGTPANFNGFRVWQHCCTAIQYWASAKHYGVEQRAPLIFGTAGITLGIGPHSGFYRATQLY